MQKIDQDKIVILDFGSQYTQLIARRIREIGVLSEIVSCEISPKELLKLNPRGIIFSGGPESVNSKFKPKFNSKILEINQPILGICYGMQLLANQYKGKVDLSAKREFGHSELAFNKNILFKGVNGKKTKIDVWMSHGDKVVKLPKQFKRIASSTNSKIAAFASNDKQRFGVQFHPEVSHTDQGQKILSNFALDICGCKKNWTSKNIIDDLVQNIKDQVGNKHVLLGISGGVDSSVVAALISKAIGKRLHCIFVDNGLLRKDESIQVNRDLKKGLGLKITTVNAEDIFLKKLKGRTDPEEKRKIIGRTFIDVFSKEAKKIKNIDFLAQGTIYPDYIESAGKKGGKAHVIKSHHNVGGLPEKLKFPLVEPLKFLFKDEVRKIGRKLGLPAYLIERHPFPGPGLGVRLLGAIDKSKLEILREADAIFMEELIKQKLYNKISQAYAAFLPVKSVGVVGDARRYEYVIALRAVVTLDFMTANVFPFKPEFLNHVSTRIMNEIDKVSRVVYDISSKPPATIEWE